VEVCPCCPFYLIIRELAGLKLLTQRTRMNNKSVLDMEKAYSLPEFISKLRRLADALEQGKRFEIQIAGERVSVPLRAICTIEHEREGESEEIEFQIKWENPQ